MWLYITMFAIDQLARVLPDFIAVTMRDRHKYNIVYDAINEYICESTDSLTPSQHGDRRIVVSGNLGTLLLLNANRGIDDFTYTLYTESAFLHANNLTNKLAQVIGDKWFLFMKTVIQNNEFEIVVDNRRLVRIIRLINVPEGTTMINVIKPDRMMLAGKPCLVMNPMFYLIDIYRTLYSPEKYDNWQSALNHEKILFEFLKREFTGTRYRGGKHRHYFDKNKKPEKPQQFWKEAASNDLTIFLIRKFVLNNPDIVLIGDSAQRLIVKTNIISPILTLISKNTVEADIEQITKLMADEYGGKYPITSTRGHVKVIGDFRLVRTTIKAGSEHDKKDLVYIYNSADYELIPFNKIGTDDFIQIGNPFVILRYHLIDIWIIRWLVAVGKLDDQFASMKISKIIGNVLELRTHLSTDTRQLMGTTDAKTIKYEIDISCVSEAKPYSIFQPHTYQYIGTIRNETVALKTYIQQKLNAAKARGVYSGMYHPQRYFLENGKYRDIESDAPSQ